MEAGGRIYHKLCFRCSVCKNPLKLNNYSQSEGLLYCKTDYQKQVLAKNAQISMEKNLRGSIRTMEQVIVIALDHSAHAENAVKFYLERVHRPGNKVVLVHCVELPELSIDKARDSHMSPGVLASMWKEEEIRTKALEEKMTNLLKEKGVPGKLRTSSGKPGEVICNIAEEENAAMIITGTRGTGKIKRTILGSVSDYLVNHAVCPVMVCRDPAKAAERRRITSGDPKSLPGSGNSMNSFTANLRQRFASGGKSRSQAGNGGDKEDRSSKEKKESSDPKVVDAKESDE